MERRRIGSLGVSVVGLGCNNFGMRLDAGDSARVVHAALDAGINFFDTADIYGAGRSEEYLGGALGVRRADVLIATKFGKPMDEQRRGGRPEYVHRALEDSLRRLETDYVDLYQLHDPDPAVPIADTLGALDELVRAGKAREIGCSNFTAAQIGEAAGQATDAHTAHFASVQNQYSLLHREPEQAVLAECERVSAAFIPYFPLASGLLTGKYHRGEPAPKGSRLAGGGRTWQLNDAHLERVERLRAFAVGRGHTLLELAISWLLGRPVVASVIAGATRPEQVRANVAAAGWQLSTADLTALGAIVPPA
ncbi:MAG: aldo/keto reductase [Gemmatimonadaceae bacterium]